MFTGIISDIGEITARTQIDGGARFTIASHYPAEGIAIGASIACSGVCLTVVARESVAQGGYKSHFTAEAWEEALRLTTAESWHMGTKLNLERALKAGDELGGHIVSGHVDGLAEITHIAAEGEARRFHIKAPQHLARFIAAKGSVALDGVSLTVNKVEGDMFNVLIIRHTLEVTIWGQRKIGDKLNIEIDPLARYIARLAQYPADGRILADN